GTVAHDSVGSFNGSLSAGGAAFVPGGVSGGALSLSKSNNGFVDVGNVLNLGSGDFSVAAWIKMTAGDTTEASVVLSKVAAGFPNGYGLVANNSVAYGRVGKAWFFDSVFPGGEVTSTTTVNDGSWHQVVAVYQSGGSKYLYVDGAPAEAGAASHAIIANSVDFLIGGQSENGVPTGRFTGLIDDAQIYNYALASSEVGFLFQHPGQEIAPHELPPGQWRLDTVAGAGGTRTRAPDLARYTTGAGVTLTAVPDTGFTFAGWSGDATGTNNPITVTMTGNKTITASFQSVPMAKALAHWKFDETGGTIAHDSMGSFDGTLSPAGAAFVSGGVSSGALSLSKTSNGFVNMGNLLGLANTDFSLVAWVKMTAGDTSDAVLLAKHAAYTRNGYVLTVNSIGTRLPDNKAAFIEGGSGVAAYTPEETPYSTTSVNDGNWHQVVAVYELGGMRSIYVDGAPAEDSKLSQPFNQNSVAFLIGGVNYSGVPTGRFDGLIDEVQIYNYALASSEVDFLFQNPAQEIAPHDLPSGQWRLNTIAGVGGTITRNPDLAKYANGATVTVTAAPNAGFAFSGWSGDATGTTNPTTITMTGNKTITANFQSVPVAKALAHWKFDETSGTTAHDSAGSYDGTLSSGGASFVPGGISGGALSLSKTNNGFVNMGDVLRLGSGDFSVVAWVKMNPGDTAPSMVLGKQQAGFPNGYLVEINQNGGYAQPNKVYFYDSDYPGQEVTSTTSVNDGNWHQIVGVYVAGANKYIYVDGAPAEASNASRPLVVDDAKFVIGGLDYGGIPGGKFTGLIDDAQVYNYALAASEVDFLFHNPSQEIPPHELAPGQWRLDIVAGAGGTITRNPDLAKYANGATVTVTAAPNSGFAFAGWSGDATGTTNPITITMTGNKTVTASFAEIPARILAVVNPDPKQEGLKINFDLQLISQGGVGGMNFVLHYSQDYLKEPKLDWSSTVGSALDQVNYDTPGEIRATFALPATAVPGGTQRVASVSFRTRSVPSDLNTDLGLELLDVSSPTGDSIKSGNAVRNGTARILVRHVIGDNNANNRLDVGDATIMQQLLTGLEQERSWDVTGNDVNANTSLDSGDVIKVLR
ncbi:MAG: hypothetical protein DME22_24115, partial [Verrucomicrobia bacterium]